MKRYTLAILLFLSACYNSDPLAGLDIERIETVEDQALAEVESHPTHFSLQGSDNTAAWERAAAFFSFFLTPQDSERLIATNESISNKLSPRAGFIYTIQRFPAGFTYEYQVSCRAGTTYSDASLANRNARNLARFIKTGMLEASLLVK